MSSLPGFRFDLTGASGSQGLLAPTDGWKAYFLPRGGYAAQDSTGALITFDSPTVASRFAVGNWIQAGLQTANIRQVGAVGGNSLSISGSNLTVSENDRIFLFGNTEPTVVGGSATYAGLDSVIYQRDDTAGDTYANSMITTNANGLVQGYGPPLIYDVLIQDGNQTNQGYIADFEIGTVSGISVTDAAIFGDSVTVLGWLHSAVGPGQVRFADEFATGSSTGGIQEAIDDLAGAPGTVWCSGVTYSTMRTVFLHENVHLRGAGIGVTIIRRADGSILDAGGNYSGVVLRAGPYSSPLTAFTNSARGSNVSISDLTVDGNYAGNPIATLTPYPFGIRLESIDGVRIRNVKVQNTLMGGFQNISCSDWDADGIATDTTGQLNLIANKNCLTISGDSAGGGSRIAVSNFSFTNIGVSSGNRSDEAFLVNNCPGPVTVTGGIADGSDFGIELGFDGTVGCTLGQNYNFSNIVFTGLRSYPISFNTETPVTYRHMTFSNIIAVGHATLMDGGAIYFNPGSSAATLQDIHFQNFHASNINTLDTTTHAWFDSQPSGLTGHENITFDHCTFSGLSTSIRTADVGINLRGSHKDISFNNVLLQYVPGIAISASDHTGVTGSVLEHVKFSDVTIDTSNYIGVLVSAAHATSGFVRDIHFDNVTLRNPHRQGTAFSAAFYLRSAASGSSVSRIFLDGCDLVRTTGGHPQYGVYLDNLGGVLDRIAVRGCDFTQGSSGWFNYVGTPTNVHFAPPTGLGTAIGLSTTTVIPPDGTVFEATGNTTVANITARPWDAGRVATIIFGSTASVLGVNGTGMRLAGGVTFSPSQWDAITLACTGRTWFEASPR